MAFPDSIETGIGLAGPTADIGHEAAHASSGIPRLLEALQENLGTKRTPTGFTPVWNTTIQPSTTSGQWARWGPLNMVSVSAAWTSSTSVSGTANTLGFDLPSGLLAGNTIDVWIANTWYNTIQGNSGYSQYQNAQVRLYQAPTGNWYSGITSGATIDFAGIYWADGP